jgi:hypothetical protein
LPAAEGGVLGPDFVLYWPNWNPVTVRDLLEYLGMLGEPTDLLDPAEPDYDSWRKEFRSDGGAEDAAKCEGVRRYCGVTRAGRACRVQDER